MSRLDKALELAQRAVACDAVDDLATARQAYDAACGLLQQAIEAAMLTTERARLVSIHESYAERVRLLDGLLHEKSLMHTVSASETDVNHALANDASRQSGGLDFSERLAGVDEEWKVAEVGTTPTASREPPDANESSSETSRHSTLQSPTLTLQPASMNEREHETFRSRLLHLQQAIALDRDSQLGARLGYVSVPPAAWTVSSHRIKGEGEKTICCDVLSDAIAKLLAVPYRDETMLARSGCELQVAAVHCEQYFTRHFGPTEFDPPRGRSGHPPSTSTRKRLLRLVGASSEAGRSGTAAISLSHLQYRQSFDRLLQQILNLGRQHFGEYHHSRLH